MPTTYELHWKSIPMGAIQSFSDWYCPYLGQGVYLWVLATTGGNGGNYVGYGVGKSDDIGKRWWEHLRDLETYYLPTDLKAFLQAPIAELNRNAVAKNLAERKEIAQAIVNNTWFCWAEVTCPREHLIENVEYVLQEALKQYVGITVDGMIGDAGARYTPTSALAIRNHFGREPLQFPRKRPVLPRTIGFTPWDGLRI